MHDATQLPRALVSMTRPMQQETTEGSSSAPTLDDGNAIRDRRQAVTKPVPASRVVPKPVPQAQAEEPRQFQLGQIRRRFNPKEARQAASELWGIDEGTTLLKFSLTPTDPDFPFEMTALECHLSVPPGYPKSRPTLKVGNKDIPRGFAINIETGFDGLAREKPESTLLELMKALDKNLEAFLSAPKVETVKLMANNDNRNLSAMYVRSVEAYTASTKAGGQPTSTSAPVENTSPVTSTKLFTEQEKSEASKRREQETRQIEARMGRLPLYKKSGDGIAYIIPIEPKRRAELPLPLQAVKAIQLFVPLIYPLHPCRIQLEGVSPEQSKAVERGFEQKVAEQKEVTLMGHINYLAQNMHLLAKTAIEPETEVIPATTQSVAAPGNSSSKDKAVVGEQDPDRSHIQYVTRPPEWTVLTSEDFSESDSDDLYSYDSGDESDDDGGVEVQPDAEQTTSTARNQERGTAISFPFIELYGIELLEVDVLNISVKCERCKEVTDIKGLKNNVPISASCRKCASGLSIGFRKDLVSVNAVRAGFLDLEGCVVSDMLPSTFIPTCSQCSSAYPAPGIVSVRGETTSNVCRECHQKFTFKIPQVKFLRISAADRLPPSSGPRRKKETLGLTAGTELPKRGRCRHYSKSYRWFRFSCCQKVYACDKCHDEGEEHPNEWANRMICGWCSREGNYRPEDCGFCHGVLTGKRGGGFWEGGKGTRDRVKMSRKDKRKYRRPGGSKAG